MRGSSAVERLAFDFEVFDGSPSWRDLPRPLGWIDAAEDEAGGWRLSGWALQPDEGPFEAIHAHWNGEAIGVATTVVRPDLAGTAYWLHRARESGFAVKLAQGEDLGRLDLFGVHNGWPVARLSTIFVSPDRAAPSRRRRGYWRSACRACPGRHFASRA